MSGPSVAGSPGVPYHLDPTYFAARCSLERPGHSDVHPTGRKSPRAIRNELPQIIEAQAQRVDVRMPQRRAEGGGVRGTRSRARSRSRTRSRTRTWTRTRTWMSGLAMFLSNVRSPDLAALAVRGVFGTETLGAGLDERSVSWISARFRASIAGFLDPWILKSTFFLIRNSGRICAWIQVVFGRCRGSVDRSLTVLYGRTSLCLEG